MPYFTDSYRSCRAMYFKYLGEHPEIRNCNVAISPSDRKDVQHRTYTPEEHEHCLSLLRQGKTAGAVALELAINKNTVVAWRKKAGISNAAAKPLPCQPALS